MSFDKNNIVLGVEVHQLKLSTQKTRWDYPLAKQHLFSSVLIRAKLRYDIPKKTTNN